MYGFEGVGLSEVQLSISELSVVGGGGGRDKRTSWSDLHRVRQKATARSRSVFRYSSPKQGIGKKLFNLKI